MKDKLLAKLEAANGEWVKLPSAPQNHHAWQFYKDREMKQSTLPESGFVRLSTVLKIIPVSKSTWWNGVAAGKFPKPIKISARIVAWKVEDIQKLIKTLGVKND